jgi:hypothetical protein
LHFALLHYLLSTVSYRINMKDLDYIAVANWIDKIVESSTTKAHLKTCEKLLDRYQDLIIRLRDSSLWVHHHRIRNKIFTKSIHIKV